MNTTQCLVALYQYGQEQEGRANIFAKNIHPWQEGRAHIGGPPSSLYPLLVPLQLVPPLLALRSKYCSKCTWDSFYPFPLSVPLFSRALKLKPQLGQLEKSACASTSVLFFVRAAALGDFTLCPCHNVNDQLSLVAFSKRSRLQRTFSKGTSLINKEMAIHNQIFVCLDWPTTYSLQVSAASIVPLHLKKQIWIIRTFKVWWTKSAVFYSNFDINTEWQKLGQSSIWNNLCVCQHERCPPRDTQAKPRWHPSVNTISKTNVHHSQDTVTHVNS